MNLDINLYLEKGSFSFKASDSLSIACNAPKDASGIYVVFDTLNEIDKIIYIGSSGKLTKKGTLKTRTDGGLYARLVKGKQFDFPRRKSWSIKMNQDNIKTIRVEWHITFNNAVKHLPAYVEGCLIQDYFEQNGCLPDWNEEF